MIPWTEAATKRWEDYCRRTREQLHGSGADADEVLEDLRRHLEVEIQAAKLATVTEEDMRRIISHVGEPAVGETAPPRPQKGFLLWSFRVLAILFGVLLPVGTLLFELFTGASASTLFDPIPTWFQLLAIALVPVANLWLWLVMLTGKSRWPQLLGWLSGAAIGVELFYCILYVTFVPFSAMAIIFFGLGLIPLAPYFGLLFTLLLRWNVRDLFRFGQFGRVWPALLIAISALTFAQIPKFLTYNGLARAASDDRAVSRSGVHTLRRYGNDEILLRGCYNMDSSEAAFDMVRWLGNGGKRVAADKTREIYFRVTGRPFNSVPPPSYFTRAGRWNAMEDDFDFAWDDALGGEAVAGRVKGLSLQSSRLDAVAEPAAAVVYCEWTMEFKNVSRQQREARAQIALPPGGVVSRLTLWVNGEEREAAFGGRSQTRQAYQQVAVQQRRDPVLVTTCGPDRVLMQCFPVPPDGGTMKVRIGITAPLGLESLDRGHFQWPEFLERNFKVMPDFKHTAWLESPMKLSAHNNSLGVSQATNKWSLHGDLTEGKFGGARVDRLAEAGSVWTPALSANQVIRQQITQTSNSASSRVVLVVDGSAGMKPWAGALAKAVEHFPAGTEMALILADDSTSAPAPAFRADSQSLSAIATRLKNFRYSGGCDNLPALEKGWDLAAAAERGAIIWIHDTQPVLLSPADSLRQRMERSGKAVPIFDLQLRSGPNRIAEQLDGLSSFQAVARLGDSPDAGLQKQFDILSGRIPQLDFIRDCVTNSPVAGPKVSRHIERLWAKDEAARLAAGRLAEAASNLAVRQQLVTPFSGAVVLETKQQYEQHGLTPVDPQTVPIVPEPSTWTLLVIGAALIHWRVYRRRLVETNLTN